MFLGFAPCPARDARSGPDTWRVRDIVTGANRGALELMALRFVSYTAPIPFR